MNGWLWIVLGVIIYVVILFFVWAICRAAGKDDERRDYK